MSLTADQRTDIQTYQYLIQSLVTILDKETTISSETRDANGVSNDNIAAINATLTNTLTAIDTIIVPIAP